MTCDVIVLGVGAMGSAACWRMARRGLNVLGIEQFEPGHDRGSSHGQTRIIRKAYFEHPDYVPLVQRADALWQELERDSARRLLHRCGLVLCGRPEGVVMRGVERAAAAHGLALERLPADSLHERFRGLRCPPGQSLEALFERDAGFLRVEESVCAMAEQARRGGATILTGRRVASWSATERGVIVRVDGETLSAATLVLAAGAWAARLLEPHGLPLSVRRKVQLWFRTTNPAHDLAHGAPVFAYDLPDGFFYGFPAIEPGRIKVALHTGGEPVANPDQLDRALHEGDAAPLRDFVAACLPGAGPAVEAHSACMYTMTPDEHFVIGPLPDQPRVLLAAGFSGHGFKFAPLVGEVLADLAAEGATAAPVGFMRPERWSAGLA